MWSILVLTLPAQPNAVRQRVWRALKALGCAALRDGAYLLPEAKAALFEPLADEARRHGGSASVMALAPRDAAQREEVLALFDRSAAYAAWSRDAQALRQALPRLSQADAQRRARAVGEALQSIQAIDYYPGPAAEQAAERWATLRAAVDALHAPGEPRARRSLRGIERLSRADFRGRRWATRARPWVDRLASAWLIGRFIDPQATFVWLPDPARTPRGAIGFDFDSARFTHVGARVTFEVLAASFGLDDDAGLQRIGTVVHFLDVGGIPAPEAAGLECVLQGLRALHDDDDALLAAAAAVFDALYAAGAKA